jgi:hypothetical protein
VVERADIEAKAREIEQTLLETRESVKDKSVMIAVAIAAAVVLAFWLGRRKGAKRAAIVKVYRA